MALIARGVGAVAFVSTLALLSANGAGDDAGSAFEEPLASGLRFSSVSAGQDHTCGVTTDGAAYCWGGNDSGQLGSGSAGGHQARPVRVVGDLGFASVSAGSGHTCGITTSGAAYCWGANRYGQLGTGATDEQPHPAPQAVVGGYTFTQISAGGAYTCALGENGLAWCWGQNRYGQLGNGLSGASGLRSRPDLVGGGLKFSSVSAGIVHTCGVARVEPPGPHGPPPPIGRPTRAAAYCWGRDLEGELGNNSTQLQVRPVRVQGGLDWTSVSTGGYFYNSGGGVVCTPPTCGLGHSCGVAAGVVPTALAAHCWGLSSSGQLGNGSTGGHRTTPGIVSCGLSLVDAGGNFACAIAAGASGSGPAYCWGDGTNGQLGHGSPTSSATPVPVAGGSTFTTVSAGGAHACGVASDGAAYCWGANDAGQLGDGSTTGKNAPVRVLDPGP